MVFRERLWETDRGHGLLWTWLTGKLSHRGSLKLLTDGKINHWKSGRLTKRLIVAAGPHQILNSSVFIHVLCG